MKNSGWFSLSPASLHRLAGGLAAGALAAAAVAAGAQTAPADALAPASTPMSVPAGYELHESVDMGGRMANIYGSGAMYDTLVNMQSGPRVQGESFELRALPGAKGGILDDLHAFASGFGGDPENFAKMDFSKSRLYEFSGTFRRDRRYFDYDLLGNPGIPAGYSIPIGPSAAPTGSYAWPQVLNSPFFYNTVRRMTDANLTLLPMARVSWRFEYTQNVMQGPSFTPSGYQLAGSYSMILEEMQRNSTDDFLGGVDWKPVPNTRFTFEERVTHYKGDSFFMLAPQDLTVQEPDGTMVALLDSYQNALPYGYSGATGAFSPASNCNASSMINGSTILYPNPNGGPPIVDPACNVASSYARYQPTRAIFPTEMFRFESSSIRHLFMNGDARYTQANMNLPAYLDQFQGLAGANRSVTYTGFASARRQVMAADYGIVWQLASRFSLEDQVNYSNARQPGSSEFASGVTVAVSKAAGFDTINDPATSTATAAAGAGTLEGSSAIGTPQAGYFGQRFTTNNLTLTWDATSRTTFSLTWRYQDHLISEGQGTSPHNIPIPVNNTNSGEVTIHENGGIFTVALHPASNLELNGSVEMMYNDNVFTPMGFRQMQHYRLHALYRPRAWATVSGAYNDLETHNNTDTNQNLPGNSFPYFGPLDHVSHSRVATTAVELFPNEHYGVGFDYSFSDVYMADNICFQGAASAMPGGTVYPGAATPSGALCGPVAAGHGSNTVLFGPARDFQDAPTQYGSASVTLSPNKRLTSNLGYRISSVNGSRFFTDPADVNGSMVSSYQTPYVGAAWTLRPGFIWKGEYDYYGYGEGGRSGAQWCNANPGLAIGSTTAPVVPCASVANTAMNSASPVYGFTAPRNFHANNVILGFHYQF